MATGVELTSPTKGKTPAKATDVSIKAKSMVLHGRIKSAGWFAYSSPARTAFNRPLSTSAKE
jgi:hypothetical protein